MWSPALAPRQPPTCCITPRKKSRNAWSPSIRHANFLPNVISASCSSKFAVPGGYREITKFWPTFRTLKAGLSKKPLIKLRAKGCFAASSCKRRCLTRWGSGSDKCAWVAQKIQKRRINFFFPYHSKMTCLSSSSWTIKVRRSSPWKRIAWPFSGVHSHRTSGADDDSSNLTSFPRGVTSPCQRYKSLAKLDCKTMWGSKIQEMIPNWFWCVCVRRCSYDQILEQDFVLNLFWKVLRTRWRACCVQHFCHQRKMSRHDHVHITMQHSTIQNITSEIIRNNNSA